VAARSLQIIRAQPIGPSAAPKVTGQARGEGGERMAGRYTKPQTSAFVPASINPAPVISENFPERRMRSENERFAKMLARSRS